MITFELESPTTLYLLQFFGSIFPTRIFFWCTIRSHAYHYLFPCYLLEMSLGDWADKPLIKSICVGITYTLMETMLHKEIYSSHIKGKWNIFHITPLKRPFSMTGKYYRGWILLWKIRLVRNVYLSAIHYFLVMSCAISMIGHFFLLFFVKHPERFCIGKRIWMWWVTIMPHYGLCSLMEINLQWEDAWCELIRFSLLAGNGIQIKITIKSPFHPPQCISVLIE